MPINLVTEYQKKIAERYSLQSRTDAYAGHDYEFDGTNAIKVYSIDTVATTAYTRSGTARFGNITELGDTVQTMTMDVDKAFTFSIDAGNAAEQYNIKQANACLKREIDEVITPEIDVYRLNAWATGAGNKTVEASISKSNIVDRIFELNAELSEDNVPLAGRVLFIPELMYVKFKLADAVMAGGTLTEQTIRNGYKGSIDGIDVVTVPASYMPADVNFIIKQKNATVDPLKITNYRVQKNPIGVDGDVVEGRFMYGSFVLTTKANGVGVCATK